MTALPALVLSIAACGGTVNDLLQEAKLGSPEAIERAVVAISDLLAAKERAGIAFDEGDRAAIDYMRKVALEGKVQNNRAVAISSLGRLRSVDVDDVLYAALKDEFWLSRLLAVQAMRDLGKEGFSAALVKLLDQENQPEVKREVIAALGVLADDLSIRTLYESFLNTQRDADRDEQQNAYFVLKKLTGLTYPFDEKNKWREAYRERFGIEGS
ncbi:MAG: HEAT repeat domain-containing protein [Planctomycetes bacterium]|nr:HEAT repeat domain-containing protein [Planctomycetota bacterium]